jgi:hypothetical protein
MPAPYSDYDYLFHSYDRQNVMEALIIKNVSFETNQFGTIKLSVNFGENARSPPQQILEVHFCFVEDFDAWKKATELMKNVSSNTNCFEGWPKRRDWISLQILLSSMAESARETPAIGEKLAITSPLVLDHLP